MTIIELLESYTKESPNSCILYDESMPKGLSYSKLDEMSARIYHYLQEKGVGTSDFVLINLPRGVMPVIAMIGVWKAGAAWALVEDTYAPERINYIRKDCGCMLELNKDNWEEIMNTEPLFGHENPDPHDAAYAIYTSGTTGNPKGVLHEYGNLERAIDSIMVNGETPFDGRDRLALLAPMNFVASIIVILKALSIKDGKMFVVSYATIKNPTALKFFFLEKRITITFLTPSYVRMLGTQTGPFLRMLFVGSEPANNLYNPKLQLINIYAASESGFAVGVFPIDKAYETCPIGKPEVETRIVLLNEAGEEVKDGEIGELCFDNPYVRGYINLPEETEKAFRDGLYHTGDLAKREPNGNYVLLGRSGDMIKINGNRIEPAEIEAAIKQVLGIDWAAAKGFEEKGKAYLCAYYTADIEVDTEMLRKELMKRLPYYMIPSYYVRIEKVPLKANGKMDRKALPAPDVESLRSAFVAPENEVQEKLCSAFEKVLNLSQVGIHDDFYEMGGDSLSAIELVVEAGLEGLNAQEIFRGRTPEKIAKLYEEDRARSDGQDPSEKNAEAMKRPHPLTTEQLYMVDYQLYTPKSTMCNLFTMLKFDKESWDMERMMEAIRLAVRNHPALMTTFYFSEEGEVLQKFDPEQEQELHIEKLSEFEFDSVKDTLVQPFKIIGGRLYRCRLFETEKAGYVFFDVHHTVFDGTSFKVLMGNIGKAYMGMEMDKDYYYLMLQNREEAVGTPFYEESSQYFHTHYDGEDWVTHPKVDFESRENHIGKAEATLEIDPAYLSKVEGSCRISRNEFFITVAALAIALYNEKDQIKLSWIYNGREDVNLLSTVGLLFRELPVALRLSDDSHIRDLYAKVHEQVQKGIEHSVYPYVEMNASQGQVEGAMAALLYQRDIRDIGGLAGMKIEAVDIHQNKAASENILDMQVLDSDLGLRLCFDYTASNYQEESIRRFQGLFIEVTKLLLAHSDQAGITYGQIKQALLPKKSVVERILGIFGGH